MILAQIGKKEVDKEQLKDSFKVIPFNNSINEIKGYSTNKENEPEMKFKNITIKKHNTKNLWYCRIRINGKQVYISSKNQLECLKKLKLAFKQKEENKPICIEKYTLQTWFYEWLDKYKIKGTKQVTISTINDYKKLQKHFGDYADLALNSFNNIAIINLLNNIPYQRTKQKMFQLLKTLFCKAKINGLIKNDPTVDLERPQYKSQEKQILSEFEEDKFINECANNKFGDFFLICLYQGLRRGECLGITRKDIDFDNKTININKSINAGTKETNTKNKSSIRQIPIFDKTLLILEKYKNLDAEQRLFNVTPNVVEKYFKIITNKLGVNITLHSLRHSFITSLVEKGIPEHIIQNLVGHSKDSKITKKVYTHVREKAFLDAINIINNNDKNKG